MISGVLLASFLSISDTALVYVFFDDCEYVADNNNPRNGHP